MIGVTVSPAEQILAGDACRDVLEADLNLGLPATLTGPFDVIVLSHVLEHLVDPGRLLDQLHSVLEVSGILAVALPNVAHLRTRLSLFSGKFEYTDSGVLDRTHLRFYTYQSGAALLTSHGYRIIRSFGNGYFPLKGLTSLVPQRLKNWLDGAAVRAFPNLFAFQSIYLAVSQRATL